MTDTITDPSQPDLAEPITAQSDPPRPHSCGGCTAHWSGARTAHCGARSCHQTFAGVTVFDKHRVHGHCVAPSGLGMALLSGRAYPCWGYPTEAEAASQGVDGGEVS